MCSNLYEDSCQLEGLYTQDRNQEQKQKAEELGASSSYGPCITQVEFFQAPTTQGLHFMLDSIFHVVSQYSSELNL